MIKQRKAPVPTNNSLEAWLPIAGYDGTYWVSTLGRIYSAPRATTSGGIVKLWSRVQRGARYRWVTLCQNGIQARLPVHRLVCTTFRGTPAADQCVRHLDGDSLNNCADNLVWGSQSENMHDSVRHGTHPLSRRTHCKHGHEYTPENTRITERMGRAGRVWRLRVCRTCESAKGGRR